MSVLGPLFIPRKDHMAVPTVKDNPELEKFLTTLLQRIRTNELAIQRWANSAPRLAAVIDTCSLSATMNSNGADFWATLPLDGLVNAYQNGIVDSAGSRIVIPQTGWYLVSATIKWDTGGNPGKKTGNFDVWLMKNGDTPDTSSSPLTSSGISDLLGIPATAAYPAFSITPDFSTINFATTFSAGDYIQFFGLNFVFFTDTIPPGVVDANTAYSAKITSCALDFLGATPSPIQ